MLLHLGKDIVIPLKDIIAIIDVESASKSEYTREFLKSSQEKGYILKLEDDVKSYILTQKADREIKNKKVIYTSNISSNTLKKRAGFIKNIKNKNGLGGL